MYKLAILLLSVFLPAVSLAQVPGPRPVVAVFDMELKRIRLSKKLLEGLSDYLATRLAETSRFRVVPRHKLKDRITSEKKQSYSARYDHDHQIELGKELSAEKLLASQVIRIGGQCTVSVTLFDLEKAITEKAASARGACSEKSIMGSLDIVIEGLTKESTGEAITLRTSIVGEHKVGEEWFPVDVKEGASLQSGDGLKIRFQTDKDAYVYVLLLDSRGKGSVLFPSEEIATSNEVQAGKSYLIPPEDLWFYLDEHTGIETIYVLASLHPMPDIEELVSRLESMGRGKSKGSTDREVASFVTRGSDVSRRDGIKRKPAAGKKRKRKKDAKDEFRLKSKEQQAAERRKAIVITGVVRGIGGTEKGPDIPVRFTGGKVESLASEVVKGRGAAVRAISFFHK